MHKQSQYEDLIKHLQMQLEIAIKEEAELKTIVDDARSKCMFVSADTPDGKVSGWSLNGTNGEAVKVASNKLGEHQRYVVGSIKYNIREAYRVIDIIKRANDDISEIKLNLL